MPRRAKVRIGLAAYRASVLAAAFACLGMMAHHWQQRRAQNFEVTPQTISQWFPDVASIEPPAGDLGARAVLDSSETTLGSVLQTSPASDQIIGYVGPTNVLVALDNDQRILGFQVLQSADTPSHLAMIPDDFPTSWYGRTAADLPDDDPIISGASLTSEAIAKSITARLLNRAAEPWFSGEITLNEVHTLFPGATDFSRDRQGRWWIIQGNEKPLGVIVLTTDCPTQHTGFQGPTAAMIGLTVDLQNVVGVKILASRDNEEYVDVVKEELGYVTPFAGKSVESIIADTRPPEFALPVSGSSYTANSLVSQIRTTLEWVSKPPKANSPIRWQTRDTLLMIWVACCLLVAFTHLRGKPAVRTALQILCVALGGIFLTVMVSQSMLIGWASHGVPWQSYPGIVLVAAAALLIPIGTGSNPYCHQICPHGAIQNIAFGITDKQLTISPKLHKWLSRLPWLVLAVIFALALAGWRGNFASFEVFDSWSTGLTILSIPVILFIVSLVLSPFVRTPYCHYACPTGALLKFAAGPTHRWLLRDKLAGAAVVCGWIFATIALIGS